MNTVPLPRIPHILALATALSAAGCSNRAASSPARPVSGTSSPTSTAPAESTASPSTAAAPPAQPSPARNPYEGLRDLALFSRVPRDASPRIFEDPTVHAILVDWTISKNATATLMCSADGSASIYTSTGGGAIGAGQHQQVRDAAARLFQIAIELKGLLSPITSPPLPDVKEMRFTLATDEGLLSALANVDELKKGGHALGALANQVQVVIAAIRGVSERKK